MQIYFLPPALWPRETLFASRFPLLLNSRPGQSRVGGGGRGVQPADDLEQSATVKGGGGGTPPCTDQLSGRTGELSGSSARPEGDTGMLPASFWGDLRGGNDGMRALSICLGGDRRRLSFPVDWHSTRADKSSESAWPSRGESLLAQMLPSLPSDPDSQD